MNQECPHQSPDLSLTLKLNRVPNFCQILQGGFQIDVRVGCSIRQLLCEQLNLDSGYVENRISTIFLDGKPVDDMETAIVNEGSILALSAAMPGLVGATMRRGGYYAKFRSVISHQQSGVASELAERAITVKLFNVLAEELGPVFLARGARLKALDLKVFLENRSPDFWESLEWAQLNDKEMELEELQQTNWLEGHDFVVLRIVLPV
ncbi:MAG: hypothetical protein RBS57_15170 [Desulforhabdus sp.]|jgi:hypothetical protein|nr:hypothetical protein [Desulforhabdus sp.]